MAVTELIPGWTHHALVGDVVDAYIMYNCHKAHQHHIDDSAAEFEFGDKGRCQNANSRAIECRQKVGQMLLERA